MKTNLHGKISSFESMWELYLSGNFSEIAEKNGTTISEPEINDISLLAALELGRVEPVMGTSGRYRALVEGMVAFQEKNWKLASSSLASWLLKNEEISSLLLRRFLTAANNSENFGLILSVSKKFIERSEFRSILADPLLDATYQLKRFDDVIQFFEQYRDSIQEMTTLQSVGFSYLHLERYKEAEKFLLFLYRKMNGRDYELNYDEVCSRYLPYMNRLSEVDKLKSSLSSEEKMNFGMAYLLSSKYSEALRLFTELSA